jgi:hypothetical protein
MLEVGSKNNAFNFTCHPFSKRIIGRGLRQVSGPRRVSSLVFAGVLVAIIVGLMGTTTGDSDGYIPSGTDGCNCHSSSPDESVNVSLTLPEGGYEKDVEYNLTISVTDGTYNRGGFFLRISGGSLTSSDENVSVEGNGQEATHNSDGWRTHSWTVQWTAPDTNNTTFLLYTSLVDGNGDQTGDTWNSIAINLSKKGEVIITDPEAPGTVPAYMLNLLLVASVVVLVIGALLVFRPVQFGAKKEK